MRSRRVRWLLLAIGLLGCPAGAPDSEALTAEQQLAKAAAPVRDLAELIPDELRLLALELPAHAGDALGLRAHDHVDLLVRGGPPDRDSGSGVLLSNVVVEAVHGRDGGASRFALLLVTPSEAQAIALTAANASVSLALRHEEEVNPATVEPWRPVTRVERVRRRPGGGMRAVALPVSAVGGLAGLLRAGDRVDVLSLSGTEDPWSETLAQNIEVMGTSGSGIEASVSLAMGTADHALYDAVAARTLVLTLRNPGSLHIDRELDKTLWSVLFARKAAPPMAAPPPPPPKVPMVSGGRRRR